MDRRNLLTSGLFACAALAGGQARADEPAAEVLKRFATTLSAGDMQAFAAQ